jgi:WD40 repeat protein
MKPRGLNLIALAILLPPFASAQERLGPSPREVIIAPHGGLVPADASRRFGDVALWHPGGISGSALSANGKRLATAARKSVMVWEVDTGMPIHRFQTGDDAHYSTQMLVFSADGKYLAACPGSSQIFVWDLSTGKEIKRFERRGDHTNPFNAVEFSADGSQLIVGRWTTIDVYAIGTWKVRSFEGKAKFLSRSTDTLVGLTSGAKVVFTDVTSGKATTELDTKTAMDGLANGLALTEDGKTLAVYRAHGEIELWSVPGAKRLQILKTAAPDPYHTVAFSHDCKTVFLGTTSGVCMWNAATGRELPKWERRFDSNFGRLTGLHVLPDGDTLLACAEDGLVRQYSLKAGKELPGQTGYTGRTIIATTRDSSRIAIGDQDGRVDLWRVHDGTRQTSLSEKGPTVRALAFSADAKTVAIGRSSGDLELVDVATAKVQHTFKVPVNEVDHNIIRDVFFDPTGRTVFARNWSGRLLSWNIADEKPGWGRTKERSSAFTADGKTLVSAVTGPELLFADPASGEIRQQVKIEVAYRGFDAMRALAFSPDGKYLVLAPQDRTLRFCNSQTATETARVEAVELPSDPLMARLSRDAHVESLAFSPNGKWLVTGGTDALIRVWEVATRTEVRRFSGHEKRVTFVAFGPGGRSVLSSGEDGAVYEWGLRPKSAAKTSDPWTELGADEPAAAYRAVWTLADAPEMAVKILGTKLSPVKAETPERIAQIVEQLGSGRFAVREGATKALSNLGRGAESALRDAFTRDLPAEAKERARKLLAALDEAPTGEDLRCSRAVHALELAGTSAARDLLGEWSKGAPGAFLTEEAKAATKR